MNFVAVISSLRVCKIASLTGNKEEADSSYEATLERDTELFLVNVSQWVSASYLV